MLYLQLYYIHRYNIYSYRTSTAGDRAHIVSLQFHVCPRLLCRFSFTFDADDAEDDELSDEELELMKALDEETAGQSDSDGGYDDNDNEDNEYARGQCWPTTGTRHGIHADCCSSLANRIG